MTRAVFDTQVFLRALVHPGSRYAKLVDISASECTLILSPPIIKEVLDVLHRPEVRGKFPSLSKIDMEKVIGLLTQGEVVEPKIAVSICRDPKDNKFLECALEGKAAFIVSEDKDLKAIGNYQGIQIVDTRAFMGILKRMRQER